MPTIVSPECSTTNRVAEERLTDDPKCGRCRTRLFQGKPVILTASNFDRHVNAELPLLVDFWAEWCGPCKMMAPQFEAAAHSLEPHVRLGKLDTEAEQQIAARYGIRSIPTMILFKAGREAGRTSGAMTASQITTWVRSQSQD